eukprot:COSAG02_NODE_48962_length_330_cov_0.731602_1_plen_23_part_01
MWTWDRRARQWTTMWTWDRRVQQ